MAGFNHLKFSALVDEYVRTNKGATMASLARDSGINRQALVSYCKGEMTPGADALYKVAVILRQDLNAFFDSPPKTYAEYTAKPLIVNSENSEYEKKNDTEAWHAAYDAQKQLIECKNELLETKQELFETRLELEQTKKESAITRDAKAG